ncbi:MAG: Rrf2 family transcriptional regulator [Gallionellaceae bacterium]|jgi:Rrf2 family iron-sulfur cluster assembly transcriptional regulator|nr:Rrf2 family transcriptional regulator [Gallionellaceae bacterium]
MRLTTKGRFAVTAMVDMATRGGREPVTLASISERQKISLSYLEQLFGKLRRNGIVESVRGPGGGYYLARPGVQIAIADIIEAVDEPMDATNCGGMGNCNEGQPCSTHALWQGLNDVLQNYLSSVNLQQLVDSQQSEAKPEATTVNLTKRAIWPSLATA